MDKITKRAVVVQIFLTILFASLLTGMTFFMYKDMPIEWWEHTSELGWSFEMTFVQAIAFGSAPAMLIAMFYMAQKECSL